MICHFISDQVCNSYHEHRRRTLPKGESQHTQFLAPLGMFPPTSSRSHEHTSHFPLPHSLCSLLVWRLFPPACNQQSQSINFDELPKPFINDRMRTPDDEALFKSSMTWHVPPNNVSLFVMKRNTHSIRQWLHQNRDILRLRVKAIATWWFI